MPQMSQVLRECAIGMLTAGMSTRAVAHEFNVHFSTISRLQRCFREFGSTSNRLHNRRPRATTPAQAGAPLWILGPLDSIFTRALMRFGGRWGVWGCWFTPPYRSRSGRIPLGRNRDRVPGRARISNLGLSPAHVRQFNRITGRVKPVFFSPSPKSDYNTVSAIKVVQFCM